MSTLNVSNITDGTDTVATSYVLNGSAKAWVNFNGTGTVAIRDSLNLSSLTDDGTGAYKTNFSTSFSASSYTFNANKGRSSGQSGPVNLWSNNFAPTTSVAKFLVLNEAWNATDENYVSVSIQGDLA